MAPGAMNICRKNLAPKNLDVAKPQIEIAIKPAEVRVHTVSVIMASKSVKRHSAAKKCCGWEEPAIYAYQRLVKDICLETYQSLAMESC